MNFLKPAIQAGLLLTLIISQSVSAQWYNNPYGAYNNYNRNGYTNNYRYNPYAGNYNRGNYPTQQYNNYYRPPQQAYRPYPQRPYYGAPYGRPPYPMYHKKKNNMPFTGNSDFMEELWPGEGSIYDDVLPADGPWNRSWGRAPWNRDYDNLWGKNGGPSEWINMSDPKEGVAQAWEDMLDTPNALGTMPGGWKAPSISVPNPIDVGDEFKNTAKDMPGEMRDFSDGFTYGGNNISGNKGNGKKDDGISFSPGLRKK
jgi:hypothetical protein